MKFEHIIKENIFPKIFTKGSFVECMDNRESSIFTIGKIYEVLKDFDGRWLELKANDDVEDGYNALFYKFRKIK